MAYKTQSQTVITAVDPLSLNAEIKVVSGNPVQTFDSERGEYEPDRKLVPLILMPSVSAADPDGVQNGTQTLTGVEWYDGAPAADYSNRITGNDDYEIGGGTAAGFPKYALKVRKNVPADTPAQIYCIAAFTDVRTQTAVRIELGIQIYTVVYEGRNYKLALNVPSSWHINPVIEAGEWEHTITAQLYSGTKAVEDTRAAYWWEVRDEGGEWRDITADDEEQWLTCRKDGEFVRTLTFDARMFKTASFRVTAAYYDGERPENPAQSGLVAETTVTVRVPGTLKIDMLPMMGVKVAGDFSTKVGYQINAYDNRREYSDAQKDGMLQVRWRGKSSKAGAQEVLIDSGNSVAFVPRDKGFDAAYPVAVWAEADVYAEHKVLTDGSGKVITDDSGKIIIVPTYE